MVVVVVLVLVLLVVVVVVAVSHSQHHDRKSAQPEHRRCTPNLTNPQPRNSDHARALKACLSVKPQGKVLEPIDFAGIAGCHDDVQESLGDGQRKHWY